MAGRNRDPRTKEELFDRMLSFDFDGDIRNLGAEPARLVRLAPNRLALEFPASGRTYELAVKIPRDTVSFAREAESRSFSKPDDGFPADELEATARERERARPRSRRRAARGEGRGASH